MTRINLIDPIELIDKHLKEKEKIMQNIETIIENTKYLNFFLDNEDIVKTMNNGKKYLDKRIEKLLKYQPNEKFYQAVQEYSEIREILN